MKIIGYITEEESKYYDFEMIRGILNVSRSKLYREIKRNNIQSRKYKNQHLYSEISLFTLLEYKLIDELNREEWIRIE
jgi:IS30 family transposase